MPEASAQLDYAPAPPVLRRRSVRRVILGTVLLCAISAGAWWGPGASRRGSLLYWQRQCLRYTVPGDRVVYESDPVAGAALRSADGHYRLVTARTWGRRITTTTATGHVPDCWSHMQAASGIPWAAGPVLFLHERTTPAGQRRLVVVTGDFNPDELPLFIAGYDTGMLTIEPGTWRTLPQNRTGGIALSVISGPQPKPPHLRVYAGQPDTADPSHFTIRYEADGFEHVVDGWLRDGWPAGYDTVEFKVRG